MDLGNSKILITGVTGFIGAHVARRLLQEGHRAVRGMARNPAKAADLAAEGVEMVPGDMTDAASLERAVQGCSLVIHAAAQVSSVPERKTFEQTNVSGTESLLRACAGAGVQRFLHLSSIAVFGLAPSGEFSDDSPRRLCGDPYCDTKLESEDVVLRFHREGRLPVTILRPSAVYGPGSTHWTVIPMKRIRKGKMFVFNGGHGMLNFVYIDNLVDAILLAAQDDRALGDAFIVNDGACTFREYHDAHARMAGKHGVRSMPLWAAHVWVRYRNLKALLRGEPYRVHPNGLGFLVATAVFRQTRIEQKLGHHTRVGFEEGLKRTEAWCRQVGLLQVQ